MWLKVIIVQAMQPLQQLEEIVQMSFGEQRVG
jgi:hypothetical protein